MINWIELKIVAKHSAEHASWRLLIDILHDMEDYGILTYEQRQHVYDLLADNAIAKYSGDLWDVQDLLHSDMEIRLS